MLYEQVVRARWLPESEASFRNFVCAALRATRAGGRVGAIFVGIVRRGLWHHITQDQEEHALKILKRHRDRQRPAPVERASSKLRSAGELVSSVLSSCGL